MADTAAQPRPRAPQAPRAPRRAGAGRVAARARDAGRASCRSPSTSLLGLVAADGRDRRSAPSRTPTPGSFTLSNVKIATHGIYLHGFEDQHRAVGDHRRSCRASSGFLIAYAIYTARRGAVLRRVAITASGVFANFGGVPLAFLFIATLGTTGIATGWLTDIGFNPYSHGFNLYDLGGVALVYMYFQIPLMVLVILPASRACGRPGARRPRTWAPGPGSTGATSAARC